MRAALIALALALALASCAPVADDEPLLDEHSEAVTYEAFSCYNEQGTNCRYPRSSYSWTRFYTTIPTTMWGHGEGGEGHSDFNVLNYAGYRYIGSGDSVRWTVAFQAGSPCNTYGNCKFFICIEEGTAWPRCAESYSRTGATSEFQNDPWPPQLTKRFRLYYQVLNGSVPTSTTEEYISVDHTPL